MQNPCPDFAFLHILFTRLPHMGTSLVGQPVNTVIAEPQMMLVPVLGLLFREVCLDLDWTQALDVWVAEISRIFSSIVERVCWSAKCLDHGLAVNDDIRGRGKG
jgi:hypothetical protein